MYLVDASILLEVELEQERHTECERLLEKIEKGEIKAVIPDFSVDSIILVLENHERSWKEMREFLESLALFSGLSVYATTLMDKIKATEHMKNFRLDFDDSIVLQSALSNGINEIISLDKDFDKVKIIKRIEPGSI